MIGTRDGGEICMLNKLGFITDDGTLHCMSSWTKCIIAITESPDGLSNL